MDAPGVIALVKEGLPDELRVYEHSVGLIDIREYAGPECMRRFAPSGRHLAMGFGHIGKHAGMSDRMVTQSNHAEFLGMSHRFKPEAGAIVIYARPAAHGGALLRRDTRIQPPARTNK